MENSTPKSVHITNYYHENSGGISTAYNHLLDAANRHRRFVTLIVPGETEKTQTIGSFGKIYFVKADKVPFFDKRYRAILPQMYMLAGSSLREILLIEKPDLIEVCDKYTISWIAGMIRKGKFSQLRRPVLVHMSCERMDDNISAFVTKSQLGRWFSRKMMGNLIYPMFDYYAANSKYTMSEMSDTFGAASCRRELGTISNYFWRFFDGSEESFSERSFIHEPGVDTEMFSPARKTEISNRKLRDSIGVTPGEKIILYAGRISPEKNIEILPEVIKILNTTHEQRFVLVIAGDGPKSEWLKSALEVVAPGMYRFCGHLTKKSDLADLYANSDVFLHPNPKEPFGIGPLEALASGTPVVVPNSGGVLSYCNDENSWLVNGDASKYGEAVRSVFQFEEATASRVRKGRITADSHTWKLSTDRIFANYDEMVSSYRVNE